MRGGGGKAMVALSGPGAVSLEGGQEGQPSRCVLCEIRRPCLYLSLTRRCFSRQMSSLVPPPWSRSSQSQPIGFFTRLFAFGCISRAD